MFKHSLIAGAVAAAALVHPSHAADLLNSNALAVKAPAMAVIGTPPCQVATASTPLSCSGFYLGAGIGGQGSNADILGSGINGSVFAGGITPTLDGGYQYVQGNWLLGAEMDAGYSVGTKAQVNGIGNGFNGFRLNEVFKVGGNLSGLLGTQAPITIPASLANAVLAPYAHIGAAQWQLPGAWAGGLASGAGVEFDFGPHVFGDLRYTYTNFNGAKAGGVTVQNDQSVMFLVGYKF